MFYTSTKKHINNLIDTIHCDLNFPVSVDRWESNWNIQCQFSIFIVSNQIGSMPSSRVVVSNEFSVLFVMGMVESLFCINKHGYIFSRYLFILRWYANYLKCLFECNNQVFAYVAVEHVCTLSGGNHIQTRSVDLPPTLGCRVNVTTRNGANNGHTAFHNPW